MPESLLSKFQRFSFTVSLLKIRLHSRANRPAELGLVISIEAKNNESVESVLLTYQFHGLTGARLIGNNLQTCTDDTCQAPSIETSRTPDRVFLGAGHVRSIQLVDTHLSEKQHHKDHSEDNYYQHSTQHYILVHESLGIPHVSLFPPLSTPHIFLAHGSSLYTHIIHHGSSLEGLTSFKVV